MMKKTLVLPILLVVFATVSRGQINLSCPTADPAGIFDGHCNFNSTNYATMASNYGTATMIPFRFGGSWSSYHASDPALTAPSYFASPILNYTQAPTNVNVFWTYGLGNPLAYPGGSAGDTSDTYFQVAYVYDATLAPNSEVDGIQSLQLAWQNYGGQPQASWAIDGGHWSHPEIMIKPSVLGTAAVPSKPIAVKRAMGASEYRGSSYMLFQSGQLYPGAGGNTAMNFDYANQCLVNTGSYLQSPIWPSSFQPVDESVTNAGEFLLVLGWDTTLNVGEVGVIAVGSGNLNLAAPELPVHYEWPACYPGFRNYSMGQFFKWLGVITLTGVKAPTTIEALGNWVLAPGVQLPGNTLPGDFPLSTLANWNCFGAGGTCAGSNIGGAQMYNAGGFALVGSRYERTVTVINLNPLFQYIKTSMFTSLANFNTNMANVGLAPGTYPATFAENPSETPTVVTTLSFSSPVTAVSGSLYPDNLGFVATEDGLVHVLSMGGLQTGGNGTGISETSAFMVGQNITHFTHMRHWAHGGEPGQPGGTDDYVRYQYICVSRGDKTITWFDMSTGNPVIIRTLRDSRMNDIISAEDNDNHGTESYLLDVADYGGKDVLAYRYGPVIQWTDQGVTYGMGPGSIGRLGNNVGGNDPFSYEGNYTVPTGPFELSGENVP